MISSKLASKYKYFDTHIHLNIEPLSSLINIHLEAARANKILLNVIGVDVETSKHAVLLAQNHDGVVASVGIHPESVNQINNAYEIYNLAIKNRDDVVAIGECGLDYHYKGFDKAKQKKIFILQINLAIETKLPLIIHVRDAHDDCIKILEQHINLLGNVLIHCFDADATTAKRYAKLGCYFAIGGKITYPECEYLRDAIKQMPLDRIVSETDAPFLSPAPNRRSINEPSNLMITVKKIGEILKINEENIKNTLYNNAIRLFSRVNNSN
jgi:TatD DNase family protein